MKRRLAFLSAAAGLVLLVSFGVSGPVFSQQSDPQGDQSAIAVRPSARDGSSMAYDPLRKVVILFGGYDPALRKDVGDTWKWNGKTWTRVATTGPKARNGAGMAFDVPRNKIVLFGGVATYEKQADTWTWNGTKWAKVNVKGPEERFDHSMAYYPRHRRVLLFGGWFASDTWEWTGSKWIKIGADLDRDRVAMAYDKNRGKMVFFGGFGGGDSHGDTWEFNGKAWIKISESGPPARNSAAMAYDEVLKKVVLFGGHNWVGGNLVYYGETWAWNGASWTKVATAGPGGRSGHAMASDTLRKRVVLFGGGRGETRLGDTWEWNGKKWTKVDPK